VQRKGVNEKLYDGEIQKQKKRAKEKCDAKWRNTYDIKGQKKKEQSTLSESSATKETSRRDANVYKYINAYLFKARTVKQAEEAVNE
jgi:hypothetical protein